MTNDKELDQFKAENRRLKRLLTRIHKDMWGATATNELTDSNESVENLPLYISSVLISQIPFNERINKILKVLGAYAEVSRIYIFENSDNATHFSNTFEWCNDGVISQINNLQNFSYSDFPLWKKMLTEEGIIKASDIQSLPADIYDILKAQNIESILVIPLYVNGNYFGFIGFDECSYNREWLPLELDLLKMAARLISSAYETEFNQRQILKHSEDQKLLLDISRLLVSKLSFNDKINTSIENLGKQYQLQQVLIYEVGDNDRFCSLTNHYQKDNSFEIDQNYYLLNFDRDLPGWLDAFKEKGFFSSDSSSVNPLASNIFFYHKPDSLITAVPIQSKEMIWGMMVIISPKQNQNNSQSETIYSTIADMMAGTYDRENANLRIRQNHEEILNINKTLEKKEAFLQNLLSSSPVGIMLVRNRRIEYINAAILNNSGYSKEELIGSPLSAFYYHGAEDQNQVDSFYQKIDQKGIASIEVLFKGKHGKQMALRVLGTQAPDNISSMSYLLIAEDISLIKEAQKSLQESEDRNQKIIESTIDGIFILNNNNNLTYANRSGLEMLGYTYEELSNVQTEDIFPDDKFHSRFKEAIQLISSGHDYIGDVQLRHHSKAIIHAEVYATGFQLKGQPHTYFSLHNITSRVKNEEELKLSEQKFRALTENSQDHIIRIDRKGTLSFCNAAFINDFNLELSFCLGKKLSDLNGLPFEFTDGLNNAIGDVLISKSITPVELEFKYNGQMYAFDWTITPETNDDNQLSSLLLVGRNFTLRKRAEQELIVAKEKAESADNLKSAFLANMSHEIRTPLNAIVGFTNLLREDHITEEEKEEYVQIINSSSENLMSLINDIVDLAKIESGELSILLQETNPNETLEEIFKLFEKRMNVDSNKHLKFYLNIPENSSGFLVSCDVKRLKQVLLNLLGNAFKFTPKGFIEIGYTKEGDQLRIYVRDTGIGISQEKQSIIFDPFRQETEDTSQHYGGTGLGLSISKRLIEAMKSKLELTSEKNKGSEFYFLLPLKETQSEPVTLKVPKPLTIKNDIKISLNTNWSDKILLLVDATSTAQLQMRKNLEHTKITLISARTPNSARELLLKRNDIDLVLIDVNMPGLNAEEFIKSIRQLNINIPFIAQSIEDDRNKLKPLLTSGFDDTITKPVQKDELLEKISIALNGVHKSQLN